MTRRPRVRAAARGPKRPRTVLVPALVAALILGLGLVEGVYFGKGPAAPEGSSTDVVLAPGAGLPGIAKSLEDAGVIRSRIVFIVAAKVTGAAPSLKAGEYRFPSGLPMSAVMDGIRKGAVVRHTVTIPEGLTSRGAVEVLQRSGDLTGEVEIPPEGALLPETYAVRVGEPRAAVLARMETARDHLLANLWSARSPGLPYRSSEDAVILASIVEKETAKPRERPLIAAVFINRLEKGMRLESDPTVVYGLSGGVPLGHGLRVSELQSSTPYNTYLVSGLPPTPIANPGRAALEAALDPAQSDDLYFVADGTGGHVFTDDFHAHLKNVARWRAIEQARAGGAAS